MIEGQSLIARILGSIPSELEIIIVGEDPQIQGSQYLCLRETPTGGGPVAGFKAGLDRCESEIVALIATDMPFAISHVLALSSSMKVHIDAVMYVDAKGFRQPLAALYRVESAKRGIQTLGEVQGKSMRELLSHLAVVQIPMERKVAMAMIDIDTVADLESAIAFLARVKDNSKL